MIRGLIQTTVNRTHLNLERRRIIEEGSVVDWTDIRSLIWEIDFLFSQEINSRREKLTIENLIVEIRIRANHIYLGLANTREFETSITAGISAYSRFIRRRATNLSPDFRGFRTTLLEQFHFGILNDYNRNFQINHKFIRYSQYRERIIILVT